MGATDIRAAGGVVWRTVDGDVQVALVHRPRYDDWSLPKGKLHGHETPLLAAVREVGEETGRRVAAERHLRTVRYDVGNRAKAVQYWAMRDLGPLGPHGAVADPDEVDRVVWSAPDQATRRLSYADDRSVLAAFTRGAPTTSVLLLVRHARAGKRSEWPGDDDDRPLDTRGRAQAQALVPLLELFAPTAVYAADRVRCEQTVAPLAQRRGLPVTSLPEVSDEAHAADPARTVRAVEKVLDEPGVAVVCSQGGAIPGLLEDWLPPRLRTTVRNTQTRKGAYWVIGTSGGVPAWIDRYDRPAPRAG